MDRVQQLADLLHSMTAVDLAPRLERGMPRYPAHPHLVIDPTVTHAQTAITVKRFQWPNTPAAMSTRRPTPFPI